MVGCLSCKQDQDDNIIKPYLSIPVSNNYVLRSEQDANIVAFFKEHIQSFSIIKHLCIFDHGVDDYHCCLVINSMDEFREALLCLSVELPEIDFSKYTLIIGDQTLPDSRSISKQDITIMPDKLVLNIEAIVPYGQSVMFLPSIRIYWGIYPKLPDKDIEINLILNK